MLLSPAADSQSGPTMARPLPTQSRPDPQRPSLGRRTPPREGSSYRPHIIRQGRRGPGKPTGPGGGIRTAPQPHPLTSGTQSRLPQRTQPPDRGLAPIRRTPAGLLTATPSPAERRDRLMEKAILLAVTASLCTATSSVCQRKGARSSPAAGFDLRVVFRLARQPVWLLGIAGMILGLVFQLTALRFGELALVQPVLAAGLLFVFGLPGRGRLAAGQATRLAGRGRDGGRDRRLPLPRVARVARPECRDAAPSGEPDPGTGRPKCRAASGKAARRSVLLPCRGDMPARKRPIPRGCRDRPPGPARRARP